MTSGKLFLITWATLTLGFDFSTHAATVVQTLSNTGTETDWTYYFVFQKFDASLGTLTLVTIDRTDTIYSAITINNNSATQTANGSPYVEVIFTLSDPEGYLHNNPFGPGAGSPAYYLAPKASITFPQTAFGIGTSHANYWGPEVLAEFTGAGAIDLTMTTSTSLTVGNMNFSNMEVTGSESTSASSALVLTYTYTPIPEPSTALLIICGIMVPVVVRQFPKYCGGNR